MTARYILFSVISVSLLIDSLAYAGEFTTNGFFSLYGRKAIGRSGSNTQEDGFDGWNAEFSEYTKVGLNVRNDFAKRWSFVGQVVAAGRVNEVGAASGYQWSNMFDWMYLSHQTKRWETKAGRQLFPAWLVSEYGDIGFAYPWYRPPTQVYTILPFKSFEGVSFNYQAPVGKRMQFSMRLLGGNGRPVHEDFDEWLVQKIENLYGITF